MATATTERRGAARGTTGGRAGGIDPLWSKAPAVLFRYPGLLVSIAVGALLLALAASAYPLFISASASELLRSGIENPSYTRWAVGITYRTGAMPLPGLEVEGEGHELSGQVFQIPPALLRRFPIAAERTTRAFEDLTSTDPYVRAPLQSFLGPSTPLALAGRERVTRDVRLFTGQDATDHVEIVAGDADGGALVPDLVADALHIGPGDEIVLGHGGDASATIEVGGVFRSLYRGSVSGYWRPWNDAVILYCGNCAPPPQPLILQRDAFLDAAEAVGIDHVGMSLQAPLRGELTLQQAEDAEGRAERIIATMGDRNTRVGELFTRCYLFGFCGTHVRPSFGSAIGEIVQDVHGRIAAVQGPAKLLRAAGVLIALAVVAGAGAFAMAARRVESALLFARGARPTAVAGRAAVEAALPCLLGAAAGLGVGVALVAWIGPDGPVESHATADAVRAAAIAAAGSIAAIAVVSAVSFLRRSEHHRSRLGVVASLPWEVVLIGLALLVGSRLSSGGAVVEDEVLQTTTPSVLLLLFPVLFLAGFVALSARLAVLLLRTGRARSAGVAPAPYLAIHRLAARPRLTTLMVTAAGLCLGLFVQSQVVAGSMRTTVNAKAGVYVGSDVQARIDAIYETPSDFPLPFTRAVRQTQAGELRARVPFDLLAIDPSTFASAAYWDPAFAPESLPTLVRRLDRPGERLPVIIAAAPDAEPGSITLATHTVPVDVVAHTVAFPGMTSLRPLIVVDQRRLVEASADAPPNPLNVPGATHELWIRGDVDEAEAALGDLPYVPGLVVTAAEVKDIPYIAAVIESFSIMNVLGLVAALLVFAAILMYLQARQRSEIVSYGLSLRMGMRSLGHLVAIGLELGAMLVAAFVAGSAFAIVAARFTVPLLDPLEAIPPEPITVVPLALVVGAAPVLALAALAGGWLTERRARAADLGQVMRLAE